MRFIPLFVVLTLLATVGSTPAQEKRGWLFRVLHPFSSTTEIPQYKNQKLSGLLLSVELPLEPVKLSEVRQLPVHVLLSNRGDHAVELSFSTEQRIEILLRDAAGQVVTRWSDNRAFEEKPGTLLINSSEHVEYSETIATRELVPGKVFTVEVMIPAYPELDVRRKSIAAQ